MLMNISYGYTASTWSGRMPCTDVADSVVATGKKIMQTVIKFIE